MRTSLWHRAGVVLLSAVLLALITVAQRSLPTHDDLTAPISHAGDIGTPVDAARFTIDVDRVELAREVAEPNPFGEPETRAAGPDLVWVVVWATMTATEDTVSVSNPALLETAGGYAFASDGTSSNTLSTFGFVLEPGIGQYGAFLFELPENRLADLSLRVGVSARLDDRLSAEALVDLGLEEAELATMLGMATEPVDIPEPEYR